VILGHTDLIWSIWNFDCQNLAQEVASPYGKKCKIYISRVIFSWFWRMGTQNPQNDISDQIQHKKTLKSVFTIFWERKYDFSIIFRWANRWFEINKMVSECPKIMKISKSSFYTLIGVRLTLNAMQTLKSVLRMANVFFKHFLSAVNSILTRKKLILTYFRCSLKMLKGVNNWGAWGCAVRVHKNPKKSKPVKLA